MDLVLGIDLGTSYFKLGLFDRAGALCGLGRVAVEKDCGDGSLCELPVERFWKLLKKGLADACKQANAQPGDIKAVAYSSQANSFLLLDEKDKPLTPLILWPDIRAERIYPEFDQLWQREDFLKTTGLGIALSNQFAVNKILWFQDKRPEIWARTARIMNISDYLTYGLTGETVGDMGTGSLLGWLDLQKKQWWQEGLDIIGIKAEMLSEPLLPSTVAGRTTERAAELLGIKAGIGFAVGSYDHHMAAIGAGVGTIADVSESTGTVLACLRYSKKYQPQVNLSTGPGHLADSFYQVAFDFNGADVLKWYQQNYAAEFSIDQLAEMAKSIPAGCDGLIARPSANEHEGLEGFENIKPSHTAGHFTRAIMESVALSLQSLVKDLCGNESVGRIAATGGGAKSDLWLQIKADLLGVEFVTTESSEAACKGAAIFAALAANWFDTI